MRYPSVRSAAVYAVPDDPVGDRVMVAIEVADLDAFDLDAFDEFLARQPDLGPKWVPSFVRLHRRAPEAGQHEDRQDAAAGARRGARRTPTGARRAASRCGRSPTTTSTSWRRSSSDDPAPRAGL